MADACLFLEHIKQNILEVGKLETDSLEENQVPFEVVVEEKTSVEAVEPKFSIFAMMAGLQLIAF